MDKFDGLSPLRSVSPLVTPADYDDACSACEQVLRLSKAQWQRVKRELRYEKQNEKASWFGTDV